MKKITVKTLIRNSLKSFLVETIGGREVWVSKLYTNRIHNNVIYLNKKTVFYDEYIDTERKRCSLVISDKIPAKYMINYKRIKEYSSKAFRIRFHSGHYIFIPKYAIVGFDIGCLLLSEDSLRVFPNLRALVSIYNIDA